MENKNNMDREVADRLETIMNEVDEKFEREKITLRILEGDELQSYVDRQNKKMERKYKILSSIGHAVRYVFYTPVSIALSIVSLVLKIIGSIAAIGMPYGIYCIYQVVVQVNAGVPLADIKQNIFVIIFVIVPFAAFLLHMLCEKAADYLTYHR